MVQKTANCYIKIGTFLGDIVSWIQYGTKKLLMSLNNTEKMNTIRKIWTQYRKKWTQFIKLNIIWKKHAKSSCLQKMSTFLGGEKIRMVQKVAKLG